MSFGKIFESTFTGSMVGSGPVVFAVWSYIIAHTRPPGVVEINPLLLAASIGAKPEEIEEAIRFLESEDPRSRNKDFDGKRLIKIDTFLYEVPSFQKYREARNDEERKAYNAQKQREHREKLSNNVSLTVNDCQTLSTLVSQRQKTEDRRQKTEAHPPTGGKGGAEKKTPSSPLALRLAKLFNRRATTEWSVAEIKSFKKVGAVADEDLELLEAYYAHERAKGEKGYHRRDLATFLNNFNGEIDRARSATRAIQISYKP